MQQQYADDGTTTTLDTGTVRTRCEQLHLRNYDESRCYRLTVSLSRPEGGPEHESTHELGPGEVSSELEIVPPGRYEVEVSASFRPANGTHPDGSAGTHEETTDCNVGDRPPQTIVVECGNGVVAVSEGLSG